MLTHRDDNDGQKSNEKPNRGVLPKMLRHEKAVGNSNMVRLELLKPKWVSNDEMNRAVDNHTGSLIKPVIVVNEGNTDWYTRQFPLLI